MSTEVGNSHKAQSIPYMEDIANLCKRKIIFHNVLKHFCSQSSSGKHSEYCEVQ